MEVLIDTGDVILAAEIREVISKIIEKEKIAVSYNSRVDTYVTQARKVPKSEILICLLPDWRTMEHSQRLETLRRKIVKKLSLADSHVVCARKFP